MHDGVAGLLRQIRGWFGSLRRRDVAPMKDGVEALSVERPARAGELKLSSNVEGQADYLERVAGLASAFPLEKRSQLSNTS